MVPKSAEVALPHFTALVFQWASIYDSIDDGLFHMVVGEKSKKAYQFLHMDVNT
jgi:hypothetical protein